MSSFPSRPSKDGAPSHRESIHERRSPQNYCSIHSRCRAVYIRQTRDRRVPSQTTTQLTVEDTDEDAVNPRGSHHRQFVGCAGLGSRYDPGGNQEVSR
ncbi:hypothetical protein NITLEN_10448 [Nitrospira lenta]|uniref:Uncharacterized protein n=1 Tax=Nitrospira lenta TaxID=1436998 RepID=A0A330L3D1_9BACT|nr:hypothetical protein NITLEN_10448 [Nitrospira lenta]